MILIELWLNEEIYNVHNQVQVPILCCVTFKFDIHVFHTQLRNYPSTA